MSHSGEPDWLSKGLDHIWLPYAQMKTASRPTGVVATQGSRITLADGRQLIDGVGSWWTAVHGYNHPVLIKAAKDQLDSVPHAMLGGLANEPAYRLAERLAEITPGDLAHVFFSESGSVAVEVAMKIAVQYWLNRTGERRTRFVSCLGGYHGDTFMTMSVCDPEEGMHSLFADVLPAQHIVPLPQTEEGAAHLESVLETNSDIAAVMVEPLIQGAGGMRMHDAATLRALREICDRQGVLLIFDEIFTGFGRTGAMFAAEKAGVSPDIMTLGKALTGGITPLAATIASEAVFAAFYDEDPGHALMHGPTYSGHATGCAVANASLDLFAAEPRLEQVAQIEAQLKSALEPLLELPAVDDVRVMG
ncbi:MAG: adenosylmethionine--8-amino-7-oxononanoate transaminase, partial [Alphaproteobacteria bacterium]|nr:adenosylmethionine--8-amino-7-oxononanoate transaminase [Alphaproteobacteria bacterium]